MKTSTKNVITISKFLINYIGIDGDKFKGCTHEEMLDFLLCSGIECPKKVCFYEVSEEDILTGKYLLVMADDGVVPYVNPIRVKTKSVLLCNNEVELARRRKAILEMDGYGKFIGEEDFKKNGKSDIRFAKNKKKRRIKKKHNDKEYGVSYS